jgi:hypothetical protein
MDGEVGDQGHPGMDVASACTVYTLWGKSSCPDGDETLTSGYAASPVHYQSGGGATTCVSLIYLVLLLLIQQLKYKPVLLV